jgi:hypothetical protein
MLSVEKSVDNDAEKEIQLFANLCELTPENLLDLDMADYSKLQKAYHDFGTRGNTSSHCISSWPFNSSNSESAQPVWLARVTKA